MTKVDRILTALMDRPQGLSVREAAMEYGTSELRKICCVLKDKGFQVYSVWEQGEDRYGNSCR